VWIVSTCGGIIQQVLTIDLRFMGFALIMRTTTHTEYFAGLITSGRKRNMKAGMRIHSLVQMLKVILRVANVNPRKRGETFSKRLKQTTATYSQRISRSSMILTHTTKLCQRSSMLLALAECFSQIATSETFA
jgi:hypothetical protein